jgi:acyl carrier protein
MEINQFIANFAAQFDDTDADEFKAETKFREIDEWSSLVALSVIAMTDEEYQVVLKGEDIRNAQTIQDLYNIINARV